MSSIESQSGAIDTIHRGSEFIIGPFIDEREAADDILVILGELGVDLSDCVFSGHANPDLSEKEKIDFENEYNISMPDEAPDDAVVIWFGTDLTGRGNTENPVWYAYNAGDDLELEPILDVFSISVIRKLAPRSLVDIDIDGIAWLTKEQLEQAKICRFIINS